MNQNNYRLVYSRVRGMLIAVEETACASGNSGRGETRGAGIERESIVRFAVRRIALAALIASAQRRFGRMRRLSVAVRMRRR